MMKEPGGSQKPIERLDKLLFTSGAGLREGCCSTANNIMAIRSPGVSMSAVAGTRSEPGSNMSACRLSHNIQSLLRVAARTP